MLNFLRSKKFLISLLAIAIVLSIMAYVKQKLRPVETPAAVNGFLDLSDWNFDENGNVKLDGQWEFYWGKLLTPEDFNSGKPVMDGYTKVPSSWKGNVGNAKLSSKGFATYRLNIQLGSVNTTYAIRTISIRMANRIFINGYEAAKSGNPATSDRNGYIMANVPYTANINTYNNNLEIIVQVADFDYKSGGIVQSIYLGKQTDIYMMAARSFFANVFVVSCLFITGLYYIFIFFGRRKDLSLLYYGLYAITFSLFTMAYGEKTFMQMFPRIPAVLLLKLQNIILYINTIIIVLFVEKITDDLLPSWFTKTIKVLFGGYIVLLALLPLKIAISIENIFLLFGILTYVFVFIFLISAFVRSNYGNLGRTGVVQLLIALICILVSFTDSAFYVNNLKDNNFFSYFSTFIVVVVICMMISQQQNSAYNRIESMNVRLLKLGRQKDKFLLSFLQAQIKPHFLYNSLSVIAALSTREPEKAKELLYDLSDYLRGSFNFENYNGSTPLSGELATVRAYLSIEKARFRDKLNVVYDIDDDIDIQVPMLSIQPLVENALRHGILKKTGGGSVMLSVKNNKNVVIITVQDDGVGIPAEKLNNIFEGKNPGTGVGLKNIQRRLILQFGQGLDVQSREGHGTTVTMKIPVLKGGEALL